MKSLLLKVDHFEMLIYQAESKQNLVSSLFIEEALLPSFIDLPIYRTIWYGIGASDQL
jgi:hypothetical protein